jgi:peptidoglycan hydrolase-like protein with peptidoglycan-binding domain
MSSTLRAVAVSSCAALIVAGLATGGVVTAASASPSPAFTVTPRYGLQGSTVTLVGTGDEFAGETGVFFAGVPAKNIKLVNGNRLRAVVPAGVKSGTVTVAASTTLTGQSFTVQTPTMGTTTLSASKLTFGHKLLVTGHETIRHSSSPVAGQTAALQHEASGSKVWHHAAGTPNKLTNSSGLVSWSLEPAANGRYRVNFRSTHAYAGTLTKQQRVRVLPRLQLEPVHTAPVLSSTSISGTIHPKLTGKVYLQQLISGKWKTVRNSTVESGHYSFAITPSSLGQLRYRVVSRYDGLHASSVSRPMRIEVVHRTLTLDSSGPDVKALQKRLTKLHYWDGASNGDYGWDTLHAVTAFEKVQGIHPDGETGPKVWSALNHPKKIKLKYPTAGTYEVEVNIAKQVLLLGKNGHVSHILDTSTAGGYLYTNSEGGTSRAITPTGHFTIQYKLTGTRVSKLGTLYYPSYFTNTGYAIHGEGNGNDGGNVPPYPNSHGCVRITDDAVLHYYSSPWLAVGASVWVYG